MCTDKVRFNNPTLRKKVIAGYAGFDYINQHFDACKSKTGVLNKPEKSRNMIAAPKGYDSKGKDLEECVMNTNVGIVPHFINKHFHPDGCTHKYFGNGGG